MADKKKYLDRAGVSTLWSRIATEIKKEETRAKGVEEGLRTDLGTTQTNLTNLTNFVGVLPEGRTEASVIAYIDEKAKETLAAASGNSSETASSVKQQLDKHAKEADGRLNTLEAGVADLTPRVETLEGTVADHTTAIGENAENITANVQAIAKNAGDIGKNAEAIGVNAAAIALLNGEADVAGSVKHTATEIAAAKVAEIVANADADFDTLKEIADWILNDTTGAADMANDIKALQDMMVGVDTTVVAEIEAAINEALKSEGADKYALAADLNALAGRVMGLVVAGYQNAEQVGSAIDTKIAALKLGETYDAIGAAAAAESAAKAHAEEKATAAETAAKAYADGLAVNYATAAQGAKADTAVQTVVTGETNGTIKVDGTEVAVKGLGSAAFVETSAFDAAGSAAAAKAWVVEQDYATEAYSDANLAAAKSYSDGNLAAAKTYSDELYAKISPLSKEEINAAIAEAIANAQG